MLPRTARTRTPLLHFSRPIPRGYRRRPRRNICRWGRRCARTRARQTKNAPCDLNRKDTDAPFAFLATYTTRLSAQAKAQHLPLGQALREYAGAANKERLLSL